MTEMTKVTFTARRINRIEDITDMVDTLFPGNRNQQHAAARILMALKASDKLLRSLSFLEDRYNISRRTLQRTRAKLSRLGLIERISWMNTRYNGQQGWKLSSRTSTALRQLADKIDQWRKDKRPSRIEKDDTLVDLLGN